MIPCLQSKNSLSTSPWYCLTSTQVLRATVKKLPSLGVPGGLVVKDLAVVTPTALIWSLAQELPHTPGMAKAAGGGRQSLT